MLVLTRRVDEQINIGHDIVVWILRVGAGDVRIGVVAPRSVRVIRGELEALADDPSHAPRGESVAVESQVHERVST